MATYDMPRMETDPRDKSLGELFGDLTRDTANLVRQEVALARAELGQKAAKVGKDVGTIAAGGALAYAGLIVLLFGIAAALVEAGMIPWLAYVLVGLIVLVVGGLIAMQGLAALKQTDPVPHQTVETLKEDARWAKEQAKT
jgi:hypothetical protein